VKRLLIFIDEQNLYRKGLFLYDIEKYRPKYSIVELSWGFCENPMVAYQVAEDLENIIQDLEDPNEMFEDEILKWVNFHYKIVKGALKNDISRQSGSSAPSKQENDKK